MWFIFKPWGCSHEAMWVGVGEVCTGRIVKVLQKALVLFRTLVSTRWVPGVWAFSGVPSLPYVNPLGLVEDYNGPT